MLNLIGIFSVV